MSSHRVVSLLFSLACLSTSTVLKAEQDLSRYKGFQFGMTLNVITEKVGLKADNARTLRATPILLQTLEWHTERENAAVGSSVNQIVFSFYNSKLYGMQISYDRLKTRGLSDQDLIDALSVPFGTAQRSEAEVMFTSLYKESVKVIARWETREYSFSLVRSSYMPTYGIVGYDKRIELQALEAEVQAARADQSGAEAHETALKRTQDEDLRLEQERTRTSNKRRFEP